MILKIFSILNLIKISLQNDIFFGYPDLVADFSLEAFKVKDSLLWYSIGVPKIVEFSYPTSNQLQVFIETLTIDYKKILASRATVKYNANIDQEQIIFLKPSKFECKIKLIHQDSIYLITGKLSEFDAHPFRISFDIGFNEAPILKSYIEKNNLIPLNCKASITSKYLADSIFILKSIQNLEVFSQIFQNKDQVYVTKSQARKIASDIYHKNRIMDSYEISESEFISNFNDLLLKNFSYIPIEVALKKLSTFKTEKFESVQMVENLSRLFTINQVIETNVSQYESLKLKSKFIISQFSILDLEKMVDYVNSMNSEWKNAILSIQTQINDLNSNEFSDIQWELKGNRMIAIKLKVYLFDKETFNKDVSFTGVKKEFYEYLFKREYFLDLNLFNKISYTHTPDQVDSRLRVFETKWNSNFDTQILDIKKMKQEFENFKITIKKENIKIDDLKRVTERLNKFENKIDFIQNSQLLGLKQIRDNLLKFEDKVKQEDESRQLYLNDNLKKLFSANTKLAIDVSQRIKSCRICSKNELCSKFTSFSFSKAEIKIEKLGIYYIECTY